MATAVDTTDAEKKFIKSLFAMVNNISKLQISSLMHKKLMVCSRLIERTMSLPKMIKKYAVTFKAFYDKNRAFILSNDMAKVENIDIVGKICIPLHDLFTSKIVTDGDKAINKLFDVLHVSECVIYILLMIWSSGNTHQN